MQVMPTELSNGGPPERQPTATGQPSDAGQQLPAIPAVALAEFAQLAVLAGPEPAAPTAAADQAAVSGYAAAAGQAGGAGAVSSANVRRSFSLPGSAAPAAPHWRQSLWAFSGASLAIAATLLLGYGSGSPWLMTPFGATCVLAFALPDSPLAQPRSIIGGHLVAALTGFALLWLFGADGWVQALAVGLAIALMQQSRTLHAPAGATPLLVLHTQPPLEFLLTPVLSGSVLIVLVAYLVHRIRQPGSYPKYWY